MGVCILGCVYSWVCVCVCVCVCVYRVDVQTAGVAYTKYLVVLLDYVKYIDRQRFLAVSRVYIGIIYKLSCFSTFSYI